MIQEQKAKRYDEALEQLKGLIEVTREDRCAIVEEDIIGIFPELAESEDDSIKKEIIDFIYDKTDTYELREKSNSWLAWLEKQGKQKETLCDKCRKEHQSHSCQDITALERCAVEHEQKPTGKVKQKFHEGDLIKHNRANIICKVISVNSGSYYVENIATGGKIELFNAEQNFHIWTIQDAKDGDVLAAYECVVLFKEIDGLNIRCHCAYHYLGFSPTFHVNTLQNKDAFYPATKAQRDTLMKAMADAGYTFDFEKKELNKIEDEEYNGEDYGIDSLFHAQRILEKTLGKVDGYQTDDGILSHKCAISAIKKIKQNPIWHEEDENNLNAVLSFIDDEYLRRWLKDTIHKKYDKPAEWSEEDSKVIDNCCLLIAAADDSYEKAFKDDCIHYLQNLKQRMEQ